MSQGSLFDRVPPPKRGWLTEAASDWLERFPGSVIPWGSLGRWLKPLAKAMAEERKVDNRHGWAFVRPVWKRYLRDREERFIAPYEFATKFHVWLGAYGEAQKAMDRVEATRAWEKVIACAKPGFDGRGGYVLEADVLLSCGERSALAYVAAGGASAFQWPNAAVWERNEAYLRAAFTKAWLGLG
jgi:hypothetical protein